MAQRVSSMDEYFALQRMHCLTCGHWGRGAELHTAERPCAASDGGPGVCGCTDHAAWVPDSVEAFRSRYGLG